MSLDFYLHAGACPSPCAHCEFRETGKELFSANITHNLSGMWRAAGCYDALYLSEGKRASEIVEVVRNAVSAMAARPTEFRKYDSPNGWGLYEHAFPWLMQVLEALDQNPDAIVRVSR